MIIFSEEISLFECPSELYNYFRIDPMIQILFYFYLHFMNLSFFFFLIFKIKFDYLLQIADLIGYLIFFPIFKISKFKKYALKPILKN